MRAKTPQRDQANVLMWIDFAERVGLAPRGGGKSSIASLGRTPGEESDEQGCSFPRGGSWLLERSQVKGDNCSRTHNVCARSAPSSTCAREREASVDTNKRRISPFGSRCKLPDHALRVGADLAPCPASPSAARRIATWSAAWRPAG
eukprot:1459257-Pleurochrysis_carterae.AAC.1